MPRKQPAPLEVGSQYGELTVLSKGEPIRYKQSTHWTVNVRCSCGTEKLVRLNELRAGRIKTCNNKLVHFGYADRSIPAFNFLYDHVYKARAVKRGLAFGLSKDQFRALTVQNCHYCGTAPATVCRQAVSEYKYTGVDRMDNGLGYVLGNVVPCCSVCNHAKHTMGYQQFIAWARRVAQHTKEL